MTETPEHLPPKFEVPERLRKYLPQKMGFQLNGYETMLQTYPTEAGVHCENCCPDLRAEYFLTPNCDLWLVTQQGDIYVLPFGDDTFQFKFHARNYIPWRPGNTLKPFWNDYIGFQVDEYGKENWESESFRARAVI